MRSTLDDASEQTLTEGRPNSKSAWFVLKLLASTSASALGPTPPHEFVLAESTDGANILKYIRQEVVRDTCEEAGSNAKCCPGVSFLWRFSITDVPRRPVTPLGKDHH